VCDPQGVDTPRENHERLDAYIQARAEERNMDLKQIARAIKVSEPTLIGWRKGYQVPMRETARRLDQWMGWREEPSSTLALLLHGKDPVPAGRPACEDTDEPWSRDIARIKAMDTLSDDAKALLIAQIERARDDHMGAVQRAEELARRNKRRDRSA
jgi:transcriptional regulator with XRE-family HTH domain